MFTFSSAFRVRLRKFSEEDSGAITVDWVVLTASMIGLTLATITLISASYQPNSENIGSELQEFTIDTSFD